MNFQKTYLSVSMSRAWAMDHPVGDPFGGPAYGERAMPVVAVVGAAASVATGVGMLTAGAAIAGSTMLGSIVAGTMIAGGALTIVGTVTGNEKLTKIGNTLSLIGGIGAGVASMTGNLTSTVGMSDAAIQATGGTASSVGEMSKAGIDKIATSFNSTFDTNIATNVSDAFGATGTVDKMTGANEAAGAAALNRTPVGNLNAPQAGVNTVSGAGQGVNTTAGGGQGLNTVKDAPKTGMSTGEMVMAGGMLTQAAGSYMSAKAQEKMNEAQMAADEATRQRINAQIRITNDKDEYDRLEAAGEAVIYMPSQTPNYSASQPSAVSRPSTTASNFNVTGATSSAVRSPQAPTGTALPRAVSSATNQQGVRTVRAPTFQVK